MDYELVLKMRKQPVAKIFFVALLLRNAHNTMNGSQTSQYFGLLPPSFEDWVSQGPNARPLPPDSIWSLDYQPGDDDIMEEEVDFQLPVYDDSDDENDELFE